MERGRQCWMLWDPGAAGVRVGLPRVLTAVARARAQLPRGEPPRPWRSGAARAAACACQGRRERVRAACACQGRRARGRAGVSVSGPACACQGRGLRGAHGAFGKGPHAGSWASSRLPDAGAICGVGAPGRFPRPAPGWRVGRARRAGPCRVRVNAPAAPWRGAGASFSLVQALRVFMRNSRRHFSLSPPEARGLRQPLEETC